AHPARSVALHRRDPDGGEREVGYVGSLHPKVARALELPDTTAIANVDVRALLASPRDALRYEPIPVYPPQPVDVALLVDASARLGDFARFLREVAPQLVRSVELFEVYAGEGIPEGRKSLNFTVTLGA